MALLTTLCLFAYTLALSLVWTRKHGSAAFTGTGALCLKLVLLSAPGTVLAFLAVTELPHVLPGLFPLLYAHLPEALQHAVILACSAVAFAAPYLALARLFMPEALNLRRRRS